MTEQSLTIRQLSVRVVEKALHNGAFADHVLETELAESHFSPRDRALVTELVNGTLRWHGQLDWILKHYFQGDYGGCPKMLKTILEVTLYQIRFLDKIPDYAAISEGVELAKRAGGRGWGRLVNGILRNYTRNPDRIRYPSLREKCAESLALRYSHPVWLVKRWIHQQGLHNTRALCQWNNRRPTPSIRVVKSRTTSARLVNELRGRQIPVQKSDYFDDFLKISRAGFLNDLPAFRTGEFTVQDESTAIPTLLLDPEGGETILDLCAAPGGKTCHIAQLMGDSGKVIAVDRNQSRLGLLRSNVNRLHLRSVSLVLADSASLELRPVDRIMLDAPCSGFGVLSRRADLRWKRTLQDILQLKRLQMSILSNAARLLKSQGVLVYSTCTLEPEETKHVIEEFLGTHRNFEIEQGVNRSITAFLTSDGYYKAIPHVHKMDGVFAVRLRKSK